MDSCWRWVACGLVLLGGCQSLLGDRGFVATGDGERDPARARSENEKGIKALARGNAARAESLFQRALIADPNFGPAHNNLGRMYLDQGKHYLAAWEFDRAMQLMPDRPEPHNNLGLVYESAGRLDEAIAWYYSAISLAPEGGEFLGNLARARLRSDLRDAETRRLLSEVVLYDVRPEWVCWARDVLETGKLPWEDPESAQPGEPVPAEGPKLEQPPPFEPAVERLP
jgi:tetratricopeptide (TPR) repeat protein